MFHFQFPFRLRLQSGFRSLLSLGLLISSLSGIVACEPILDFSSTAPKNTDQSEADGLQPTQSAVRPKAAVDVPKDPLLQILLLTNDSSKGWQLKKRQRKGADTLQLCNQDDGLVIFSSKRIDFEIGDIRCDSNDKKQTGFWQLTDRPSLLVSNDGDNPYEAQLLELTTNSLVISYTDEENELVLESYVTPVAQEPIEEGPIVLTPTPAPSPPLRSPSNAESEPSTAPPPAPANPGSGPFKTGL